MAQNNKDNAAAVSVNDNLENSFPISDDDLEYDDCDEYMEESMQDVPDSVNNGSAHQSGVNNGRGPYERAWTTDATRALIHIRGPLEGRFTEGRQKRTALWLQCTRQLQRLGYRYSAAKVQKKWHNILITYNKNLNKKYLAGYVHWEFFEEMFKYLEGKKANFDGQQHQSQLPPPPQLPQSQQRQSQLQPPLPQPHQSQLPPPPPRQSQLGPPLPQSQPAPPRKAQLQPPLPQPHQSQLPPPPRRHQIRDPSIRQDPPQQQQQQQQQHHAQQNQAPKHQQFHEPHEHPQQKLPKLSVKPFTGLKQSSSQQTLNQAVGHYVDPQSLLQPHVQLETQSNDDYDEDSNSLPEFRQPKIEYDDDIGEPSLDDHTLPLNFGEVHHFENMLSGGKRDGNAFGHGFNGFEPKPQEDSAYWRDYFDQKLLNDREKMDMQRSMHQDIMQYHKTYLAQQEKLERMKIDAMTKLASALQQLVETNCRKRRCPPGRDVQQRDSVIRQQQDSAPQRDVRKRELPGAGAFTVDKTM